MNCEESEPGAVAMGSTLKLRADRVATARRSDTCHLTSSIHHLSRRFLKLPLRFSPIFKPTNSVFFIARKVFQTTAKPFLARPLTFLAFRRCFHATH